MSADSHSRRQPRRSSCGRAPEPTSALSATGTLAWRAMLKIKHVPFQLFDVTITPIMFTLLFTYIFGGALGGSPRGLHPVPAPRDPGADHHLHHRLHGRRPQQRHPEGPLRPVPLAADVAAGADPGRAGRRSVPLLGRLGADHRPGRDPRLPSRRAASWACCWRSGWSSSSRSRVSWIWIIFGMKVKTPESVMTTSFVFLMPLTFASNIFVGLETMPSWLQAVVRHNPVTHLTNASRGLMHGQDVDLRRPLGAGGLRRDRRGRRADRPAHVPQGAVRPAPVGHDRSGHRRRDGNGARSRNARNRRVKAPS